jgi:hypothetical protein
MTTVGNAALDLIPDGTAEPAGCMGRATCLVTKILRQPDQILRRFLREAVAVFSAAFTAKFLPVPVTDLIPKILLLTGRHAISNCLFQGFLGLSSGDSVHFQGSIILLKSGSSCSRMIPPDTVNGSGIIPQIGQQMLYLFDCHNIHPFKIFLKKLYLNKSFCNTSS